MTNDERCDLCGRVTMKSRVRREPPLSAKEAANVCLGTSGFNPERCLNATRIRITALLLMIQTASSYRRIVKTHGGHHSEAIRLGAQFDDDFLAFVADRVNE